MKHPHHHPKRILLAVSGLSPQILTETLYGLTVASDTPFNITHSFWWAEKRTWLRCF